MQPTQARFIKNLIYSIEDTSDAAGGSKGQTGVLKPQQSNAAYIDNLVLPEGYNHYIGGFGVKELRQVFAFIYNDRGNHIIYRLNGTDQTYDIVYQKSTLNFQLQPEYFVAATSCWLEIVTITNPDTYQKEVRTFLFFTDGYNEPRSICVEDSINTQSFSSTLFPYFGGSYDPQLLINMTVPTPSDCIGIDEVPVTPTSTAKNNALLFNTWQFRLRYYDVWGRPSEYGIISDLYIPAGNDCISASSGIPRCIELFFDYPLPHINQVEVAYRNCNEQQWYTSDTLNLYEGSPLGRWWERTKNADIKVVNNKIVYEFCADKRCDAISPELTNRLYNPIPRTAQALSKVGYFLGLSNNKDGFFPFSKSLRDSIQLTVEPPTDSNNTEPAFRNISILVEIMHTTPVRNEPIYRQEINGESFYGFGSYYESVLRSIAFTQYLQYFPNPEQKGFIGNLAGTNVTTISEQWVLNSNTGEFFKATDFTNLPFITAGYKYFQKFNFTNVPAGKYIFRVLSHMVDLNSVSIQDARKTSTYVIGQYNFNFSNFQQPVDHSKINPENYTKEFVVDVCEGNYDSINDNKILVIWDMISVDRTINAGYVRNTSIQGEAQYGIELMRITGGEVNSYNTDHNGFFFVMGRGTGFLGTNFKYQIFGYCNCNVVRYADQRGGTSDKLFIENFYLDGSEHAVPTCPDWENQPCNKIIIKGRVVLCNTDIGVPNAYVVLSRGGYSTTDVDGNFTIIAHDEVDVPVRTDKLYYITNSCSFTDCDGNCIQPKDVVIQKCTTCNERVVTVTDTFVGFISLKGLLSGATYPVGVVGWDIGDRPTFVQPLGNINIPSVQETKLFSPSRIRVDILPTAVFPPETRYITFWIGEPAGIEKYITWIVDKVEFIDNTGSINETAPTQIKIHYASLVEYNKQNNYNTTVNWDFIPTGETSPTVGDKVQFLLNGDGTFFEKSISAIVKYDSTGQYFLINYTNDLANLQENAFIRLVRPKVCETTEPYSELCKVLKIENRLSTETSFYLNAFDTYYVNREIPVPIKVDDETINTIRIFGVPFEHNSPSDFWGEGCENVGRINAENPQETEVYSPEQTALSGALSATGLLNFLNFFDDSRKTNFNRDVNGIVALLVETSVIAVIGQSDWFIVGFDDNVARVNEQGQVVAASIENQFGRPQGKRGNNYGCLLKDKNTISVDEGNIAWLDTAKGVVIFHNFSDVYPVSAFNSDAYIRSKVKIVDQYNQNNVNKRYFHGIINPVNMEYLLTDIVIRQNSSINNLWHLDPTATETLSYGITTRTFKTTWSFIPQGYTQLISDKNDKQLFSFVNGKPFRHYTVFGTPTYNTFYGVKCSRVVTVVLSADALKKKKFLSVAVYCKQGVYFISEAVAESGQITRVLKDHFEEAEYGWFAPILCDLNTPVDPNNKIINITDGDSIYGTWIEITFVGDPLKDDHYSELAGFVVNAIPSTGI